MESELPNGWHSMELEQAMEAILDYRGKSPKKTNNGVPLITAKIVKNGRIDDASEFIAVNDYDLWMRRGLPKAGDVVLTTEAPLGEVAQIRDTRIALAQRLVALRGKSEILDNAFLKFLLQSDTVQNELLSRATGTTVLGIKQKELRRITLLLPPIDEQREIGDILGTLDDKIELNRQMNRTLEAMARSIFKAWFVDFEPVKAKAAGSTSFRGMPQPVFDQLPDRFTDTEVGPVPEGWEVKPLDEIAVFLNGLALQKYPATESDDSLPVIKIAELRNGISAKSGRASRDVPRKHIVRDGDFIFSWSGSLLAKFWTAGEGALNQHLFKVTSESYPMWFVSQWVQYHLEAFQAIATSKATTMGHIQRRHLKEALTVCAPTDLLKDMSTTMAPLVDKMVSAEIESRMLAALRDTLLPKLISGELRVPAAEGGADAG